MHAWEQEGVSGPRVHWTALVCPKIDRFDHDVDRAQVVLASFPDTAAAAHSSSLNSYFNSMRVEQLLQQHEHVSERFASRLGGMLQAVTGSMHGLVAAGQGLMPAPPQQAGASSSPASSAVPASLPGLLRGWVLQQAAAAQQLLAGSMGRVSAAAALVGVAVVAVAVALGRRVDGSSTLQLSQWQKQQGGSIVAMVAPSSAPAAADAPADTAPVQRVLDVATAQQLLQRWQKAKACAMGRGWDASKLPDVLADPLLGQEAGKSQKLSSAGWFYRFHQSNMQASGLGGGRAAAGGGGGQHQAALRRATPW